MEDSQVVKVTSMSELEVNCTKKKIIFDLRNVAVNDLDVKKIVKQVTENESKVIQIWLPKNTPKFKEILSRLQNNPQSNQLGYKILMLEPNVSTTECFALGQKLAKLYESVHNIHEVMMVHPVFTFETRNVSVKIKTKEKIDRPQNMKECQGRSPVCNETKGPSLDQRRPKKRTFSMLKIFRSEAKERVQDTVTDDMPEPTDQKCYMCHKTLDKLFARLCDDCSKLNDSMRSEKADLHGKFAIVTGGRIKIGFQTALRLLRDGCFVIVTTRFPVNALQAYSKQPDFTCWKSKLRIFQLDLQDLLSINNFLVFVEKTVPHLDILIHNAAQTIWRPPAFYSHLCKEELPENLKSEFLKICSVSSTTKMPSIVSDNETEYEPRRKLLKVENDLNHIENVTNSDLKYFPVDQYDDDGQQLDLRPFNSWSLGLTDIPLQELLQTLTINCVAPFILTSKLKPLLLKSPNPRKFVVNVSAMEGQFSRISKVFTIKK
eukprot:GFUD01005563.1.p1 GENE.GFUD01005563.1~~GFUD01005563.1.p1  ORF type:complete len:509 (-),score=113.95 GFUD01005563.1:389-1855(-)